VKTLVFLRYYGLRARYNQQLPSLKDAHGLFKQTYTYKTKILLSYKIILGNYNIK